jgi:hypothetical protein
MHSNISSEMSEESINSINDSYNDVGNTMNGTELKDDK